MVGMNLRKCTARVVVSQRERSTKSHEETLNTFRVSSCGFVDRCFPVDTYTPLAPFPFFKRFSTVLQSMLAKKASIYFGRSAGL